jgi:DNA adenine methylase
MSRASNTVSAHQVATAPVSAETQSTSLSPPLKWAGGKRWLLPHLEPLWFENSHRRLVEPFCGGLAITLGLRPERALLNDANPHLINFYEQLRSGLKLTIDARNDETTYYAHRERFNELIRKDRAQTKEAAQLFYYLNRTGFNGLCRFNGSGAFNVPFGRYTTINYTRDFTPYKKTFSSWDFKTADFEKLTLNPDDFIYADPPYDVEFTTYSAGGFSWEDQRRAAEWLAAHPGPVILSNQATPRIIELYKSLGFTLRFAAAPRRISCTGDRSNASEVLATKNLPHTLDSERFLMSPRDTRTGGVLESMVQHALDLGGYKSTTQVVIGNRPSGRKHKVDRVAEKDGRRLLISLKWQQVGGTAEEKVAFEVICLMDAVSNSEGKFDKAYVVLGGEGWSLRDFYVGGGLERFLKSSELVKIVTLEQFVAPANKGKL